MKAVLFFLLTVSLAITVSLPGQTIHQVSLPPEKVNIEVGQQKVLELPFTIQDHSCEGSRIKVIKVENNRLTLEGTAPGNGTVTLSGGNVKKVFSVRVSGSLVSVYNTLSGELGEIPGVTVVYSEKAIILQGVVSKVRDWEYFNKVMESHAGNCSNHVRFQPGTELFENLKKDLSSAGIRITGKLSPERPGEIQFTFAEDVFTVSGYLYCREDINRVERILDSRKWLDPTWNRNSLILKKDLRVSDSQLEVNVVFVGISKNQLERMGNNQADGTLLSWNFAAWIRDFIGNGAPEPRASGLYASLNTDMKGALTFFGDNGISDFRDAGHLTITNNSSTTSVFENGGSLQVKVASQDSVDLKPIDFGLKIKISGGFVRNNELLLHLDLEKSLTPVKQDGDYFQRSTKTKAQVRCLLGKTIVIAGQKESTRISSGPSGYAFLRHVPILSWIFSHKEETDTEMYYLILVYPQLKKNPPELQAIPVEETAGVEKTVYERVRKREAGNRAKEEKNWFLKMFTW